MDYSQPVYMANPPKLYGSEVELPITFSMLRYRELLEIGARIAA
jgi:hypothetical protein